MRNIMKSFVVAGVSALALAPFAVADLEKYLPAGETCALVKIENIEKLSRHIEADPIWAEANAKLLSPIIDGDEEVVAALNQLEAAAKECSKAFAGEAVVALVKGEKSGGAAVLIADCDKELTPEKAAALIENALPEGKVKLKERKDGSFGLNVKSECGKFKISDCAIVDGKFLVATDRKTLNELVASVKNNGAAKSLTASSVFQKVRARIGDAATWCYVDGAAVSDVAYALAKEKDKEMAKNIANNPEMAIFSVSATSVVKTLAPEVIESFWAKYNFDGSSESALAWKENRGLVTLLTSSLTNSAVANLPAIPVSDDLAGASSGMFSIGKFASQLLVLGRQATPLFGFIDMQISNLKMQNILDVPALLNTLNYGTYACTYAGAQPEASVFAVKVDNQKLVQDALEQGNTRALGGKITPQASVYEGLPFYTIGSDREFGYAFLDGYLCAGPSDSLKKFISSKKNPSVWETPAVKTALSKMSAECCFLGYTHLGKTISGGVAAIQQNLDEVADDDDFIEAVRNIKVSDKDFDYTIVSQMYLNGNELVTKSVKVKNN